MTLKFSAQAATSPFFLWLFATHGAGFNSVMNDKENSFDFQFETLG